MLTIAHMGITIILSTPKDTRHSISNQQLLTGKQKNWTQTIYVTKNNGSTTKNQTIQKCNCNWSIYHKDTTISHWAEKAKKICTTILPFGKYSYKRLPMKLASAPDIFKSIMTEIFCDLDYVLVHIDDILASYNKKTK